MVLASLTSMADGSRFKKSGKRNEIFLATKFGMASPSGKKPDGDPAYVRQAFEKSISRLGVDTVDLYYLHRCVRSFRHGNYSSPEN